MVIEADTRVIYPSQGICRVRGLEEMEVGGGVIAFVTLVRERDGATVRVPKDKMEEVGVRPLASASECLTTLKMLSQLPDEPELDWKRRQRSHADKMLRGGLGGMCEVLRTLHALALERPLPQRERELYDQVRGLVIEELGNALGLEPVAAEDQIDLALSPPGGRPIPTEEVDEDLLDGEGLLEEEPVSATVDTKAPPAMDDPTEELPEVSPRSLELDESMEATSSMATKKPAAKKPAAKKPAAKKPAAKKPAAKKPAAKKPAAKKPAAKKPAAKKPAAKKPAAKKTKRNPSTGRK